MRNRLSFIAHSTPDNATDLQVDSALQRFRHPLNASLKILSKQGKGEGKCFFDNHVLKYYLTVW